MKEGGKVYNSLFFKVYIVMACLLMAVPVAQGHAEPLALKLLNAYENNEPTPNLSHGTSIDMAGAYEIQSAYVKLRLAKDSIAGFKAGLTNSESQASFGINRPIFGVLYKSGDFSNLANISLKKYHHLMVETEIGFITKKPIKHTVNSVSELKEYIEKVVPVIELPDVGFARGTFTAPDLIAANTGSTGYIIHHGINLYHNDINSLTVSLLHDGVIVNQGQGEDAMGDQWEALRWLVNQVLAHGWTIEKDNLLITGALGDIIPAKEGKYRAQFNDGALIEFNLTA